MEIPLTLLVDDEARFVQTLAKNLGVQDLPTVAAHSGQEALEKLAEDNRIDLVILDVKMPGMDGIETLRAIKRSYPLVEVIMLTGHATVESAIEGMKLGAFDYLMKPVDLDLLVSKIKAVQDRLARTERLVTLGRLAATIAHEINNPLSVVLTYIKLMLTLIERQRFTPERLEEIKKYLTYMEGETSRCGEIVKNLLAFARRSRVELKPNSMEEVIERTIVLIAYDLKHRSIELVKGLEPNLPNSAQAMTSGGTLTVETRRAKAEGFVELLISDTGPGIPPEFLDQIFEPFFSTKEEGKGVGLGLAVVQSIIARHRGTIEVESPAADGMGTRFRILLPIA